MEYPQILANGKTPQPRTSGRAIASLVLGVTSIFFACFTGVPALLLGLGALRAIKESRGRLEGHGIAMAGTILGCVTTGFYFLLILTIGGLSSLAASRQQKASHQLKNIALGMHNYHDTYKAFPWTGVDYQIDESKKSDEQPTLPGERPAGFPSSRDVATDTNRRGSRESPKYTQRLQLSWRVRLLRYIECMPLYEQFDFDQAWDSPHNKALIEHMPEIYRSPNRRQRDHRTVYQVVVLPAVLPEFPERDLLREYSHYSTPFDAPNQRRTGRAYSASFRDIIDGTSNVVMLVETDADQAVVWTKPDDWELSLTEPRRGLGSLRPGGFLVAMMDGRVEFLPNSLDDRTLLNLFFANDGEPIGKR